jgi:hypothetical protein
VQPFFEWDDEGVGRYVHHPSRWITCTSNLSVVDRQASDVGSKLTIEVGLVIAVRVSLLIVASAASSSSFAVVATIIVALEIVKSSDEGLERLPKLGLEGFNFVGTGLTGLILPALTLTSA